MAKTIAERRLDKALADATEIGLTKDQVRLVELRIRTLNDVCGREHNQKLAILTAENQRLKAEIEKLQPKSQGDPEIAEALRQYDATKSEAANGGL